MTDRDLNGVVLDGRYRVIEPIAEGAMGVVYRGERVGLGRAVAIKVLHESLPGELSSHQRFEREAKLMAKLDHPHCVSVIDFGLHDDKPFVVMELVRGASVQQLLVKDGRFAPARAADLIRQVLSGLAHAHELGIIHRDIKPANVMVSSKTGLGEQVRILDFGLARLLESSSRLTTGIAVGTPSYMAPEQCRGSEVDARADLYACGVMLFELLTGDKPFTGDDPLAIVHKHLGEPAPRLADITPGDYGGFEAIIARALTKDPADRYQTAVEMSQALDDVSAIPRSTGRSIAPPLAAVATASGWNLPENLPDLGSIAIASSTEAPPPPRPPARAPAAARARSMLERFARSRMRWVVLVGSLGIVAAVYGIRGGTNTAADNVAVVVQIDAAVPPREVDMTDPAAQDLAAINDLLASDHRDAALETAIRERRQYPQSAGLAFMTGKLYFDKLYWADGIKGFRDAIKLDPTFRAEPALIKIVIRGFLTTPSYDDRLGAFLMELGSDAVPYLEETARTHPNPQLRDRAASLLHRRR